MTSQSKYFPRGGIVTPGNLQEALTSLRSSPDLTVDTETTGLEWYNDDRVIGIAIGGGEYGWYFPFRHKPMPDLFTKPLPNLSLAVMAELWPILSSKPNIGFNYAFDLCFMGVDGLPAPDTYEEVMVAAHLVNENEANYKLKSLATKYIDSNAAAAEHMLTRRLRSLGLGHKGNMFHLTPQEVAPYAIDDIRYTRALHDFYARHLIDEELDGLYVEQCMYARTVMEMHQRGLMIDRERTAELIKEARQKQYVLEEEARTMAGQRIDLRSPIKLKRWLRLPNTKAETLEKHTDDPRVALVVQHRKWTKAQTSYYEPILRETDHNNTIHPNLLITGTISGRLACIRPNLQAVPPDDDFYQVKDIVVARPGYVLASADYSQIEVRIGAHYAQDPRMIQAILDGLDLHSETANAAKMPRNAAKRLNFSAIYGIGAKSLSKRLHISEREARQYLDRWHSLYPGYRRLYTQAERRARHRGYIRLFTGRRRHYGPDQEHHKASSNLVQGTVAEIMRVAILRLWAMLRGTGARMLLQIHDDILFELPEDKADALIPEIITTMGLSDFNFSTPLVVDVKTGQRWGSLQTWTPPKPKEKKNAKKGKNNPGRRRRSVRK